MHFSVPGPDRAHFDDSDVPGPLRQLQQETPGRRLRSMLLRVCALAISRALQRVCEEGRSCVCCRQIAHVFESVTRTAT